ncbi:hypothetical protein Drorol1_Dr00012228 [Drosera rotundifolia]
MGIIPENIDVHCLACLIKDEEEGACCKRDYHICLAGVLSFLERTTFFLYPIGLVIILSPILILSGFNPSRYVMNIYFSRCASLFGEDYILPLSNRLGHNPFSNLDPQWF